MKTTVTLVKQIVVAVALALPVAVTAQPSPAPVAAPATPLSPEMRAALLEMLDAIDFKKMMVQMGAAMTQSMPQMLEQLAASDLVNLTPEEKTKQRAALSKQMQTSFPKMMSIYSDPEIVKGMEDIQIRAYGKHLTLEEVRTTTAYYKSSAGQKMMTRAPQVMAESMPEMMALIQPRLKAISEEMVKQARDDAKAAASAQTAPAEKAATK